MISLANGNGVTILRFVFSYTKTQCVNRVRDKSFYF